jgi:hypothetical protein
LQDQGFFELAKALVGYTCDPTFIHVITYIIYWLFVLAVVAYKYSKGTLDKYKFKEDDYEDNVDVEAPAGANKLTGEALGETFAIPGDSVLVASGYFGVAKESEFLVGPDR